MIIRKQMFKFPSSATRLEVLNYSRYVFIFNSFLLILFIYSTCLHRVIECHLNKQIIVLLSALGVPDSAFLQIQDKHLNDLLGIILFI